MQREKAREGPREKTESDRCANAHVELTSLKHHRERWKNEAEAETEEDDDDDDDDDDEDDEEDEEDDRPASLSRLNRPTLALHPSCTHTECMWWVEDVSSNSNVSQQTRSNQEWRNPVEASRIPLRLFLDYADGKGHDKGR
ncbi:hypothetical protein ACS0PU_008549 [Formica fusca]